MPLSRVFCIAGLLTASISPAFAASYGPELQGFQYPYPLEHFHFQSQGKALQMGYMDVPAKGQPNGRSVVLMHGKNFCGATWEGTIKALSDAGYRVVAPDQIGFCSSSKPDHYQYSFQQLALNCWKNLAFKRPRCSAIPPVACSPPVTR
jgi:pimeloyl-ACP methyl ester carboxylesterase